MEDMFQVGAIASTHGVRGEVKIYPMTDDVVYLHFECGTFLYRNPVIEKIGLKA